MSHDIQLLLHRLERIGVGDSFRRARGEALDAVGGGVPIAVTPLTIPAGQEAPVDGAQQLTTGEYGFICTVHPFMTATLVVTERGTPLPPPGSPPPPEQSPPPGAPPSNANGDTRPPRVTASLASTSIRRARRARAFSALVTSDEQADLRLRLVARLNGRVVTLGTAATAVAADQTQRVRVRLKRSARRALARRRRVTLTLAVEARDDAGNVATATARRTVRRR